MAYTYIKLLAPHETSFKVIFLFFISYFFIASFSSPGRSHSFFTRNAVGHASWFMSSPYSQWFIVRAYRYAGASKIGVFQYSTIIWVGIIDWIVWEVKTQSIRIH
ncbi:MAG: hypothetical protein ACSNEK_09460 [Parachlamydiaceae bacterium]